MSGLICPIVRGLYKKSIRVLNSKSAIIKLRGITHVVIEDNSIKERFDKEKIKKYSYNILKEYDLLKEKAAGVLYIDYLDNNTISLTPIVFVKDINTLFYETACGSGTVAVGIYESFKRKRNVDMNIIQPSGSIINVQTIVDKEKIYNAIISGKVIEYKEIK